MSYALSACSLTGKRRASGSGVTVKVGVICELASVRGPVIDRALACVGVVSILEHRAASKPVGEVVRAD